MFAFRFRRLHSSSKNAERFVLIWQIFTLPNKMHETINSPGLFSAAIKNGIGFLRREPAG